MIVVDILTPSALGDVATAIAVIVSANTFYISRTRASRSEQTKTSRDKWACIIERFDKAREISKTGKRDQQTGHVIIQDILWSVVAEIDYFAYVILSGEIKDRFVLGYYKTLLSQYIESIINYHTFADQRHFLYED
jgi:hypothetical protein